MKSTRIPKELQPFFASAPLENLDVDRDKSYIIQTLLKKSNLAGWQWLNKIYTHDEIRYEVIHSRQLRPKDTQFWIHYLSISPQELTCLQTKSQNTPEKSWKY